MTFRAWICETCRRDSPSREHVWECPGCGVETCERCFDRLAHCKPCGRDKADEELRTAANAKGWEFEYD